MKSACSYLRIQVRVQITANGEEKNNSEDSSDSAVLKIFANTEWISLSSSFWGMERGCDPCTGAELQAGLSHGPSSPLKWDCETIKSCCQLEQASTTHSLWSHTSSQLTSKYDWSPQETGMWGRGLKGRLVRASREAFRGPFVCGYIKRSLSPEIN